MMKHLLFLLLLLCSILVPTSTNLAASANPSPPAIEAESGHSKLTKKEQRKQKRWQKRWNRLQK